MKKKGRGGILLLMLLLSFCVVALWFFWPEIAWRIGWGERKPPQSKGAAKEKIYEDERRKLDELLKQQQSK